MTISLMGRIDRKHRGNRKKNTSEKHLDTDFGESSASSLFRGTKNGYVISDEGISAVSTSSMEETPWRKILYEKQPFPDNYCSPKFLNELQKNVTAQTYTFDEAVRGSLILMHQVNSVALYVITFAYVGADILKWHVLLIICVIMALLGYCLYAVLLALDKRRNGSGGNDFLIHKAVKTLALYVGFGYGLSPVFKTLTETISTDTIYALATLMFMVNIIFADYGVDVAIISSALSLNAGIFGAVCLISRLSSSNEVFSVLTLAVETFVLWPLLRWKISAVDRRCDVWLAVISATAVILGLCKLSTSATFLYIALHLFVSVACPWGLMKMQPLKSTIHGPWDEAIVVS